MFTMATPQCELKKASGRCQKTNFKHSFLNTMSMLLINKEGIFSVNVLPL